MSISRPQQASSEGEGRPPQQPAPPPLRLRVPELSGESHGSMELWGEAEEPAALAETPSPCPAPPQEMASEPAAPPKPQEHSLAAVVHVEAPIDPEAAVKPSGVGRRLRFDPPSDHLSPAARGEASDKPPYMTAGSWVARLLIGSLWASGGALATAAIIVIGLFVARSGGETGKEKPTEPPAMRWSQDPETPLRTAQPRGGSELSQDEPSRPEIPTAPKPAEASPVPAYQPQTLPLGVAREAEAEIDPADLPLEAPVRPPVAEQQDPVGALGDRSSIYQPAPQTPPQGEPTGHGREIHNPYFAPQPAVQPQPQQAYGPTTPQAGAPQLPALPVDVASPYETYPRTNGATWEFKPQEIAERDPLRTSMRPAAPQGDGQPGTPWPVQDRGQIDGGQYRLQGTIDQVPLR